MAEFDTPHGAESAGSSSSAPVPDPLGGYTVEPESHEQSEGGSDNSLRSRLSGTAERLRESSGQAREYVGRKVDEVTGQFSQYADRVKNLDAEDMDRVWENVKSHARQNPGQMMLVAAAAGFVLGMIMRGSSSTRIR